MLRTVDDNRTRQRFEIRLDGNLAGFADYQLRVGDPPGERVLMFTHTEVDAAQRGGGIATELIGAALAQVRADGGKVLPMCSFVADYVDRHPEYADLVAR